MQYVTLGKTGLQVSRLGLGGIPIQKADVKRAKELLGRMVQKGMNYIDSARGYTVSEAVSYTHLISRPQWTISSPTTRWRRNRTWCLARKLRQRLRRLTLQKMTMTRIRIRIRFWSCKKPRHPFTWYRNKPVRPLAVPVLYVDWCAYDKNMTYSCYLLCGTVVSFHEERADKD